jgi:ABC-type glycerol-3-phosphate transport system substrate-binding protein
MKCKLNRWTYIILLIFTCWLAACSSNLNRENISNNLKRLPQKPIIFWIEISNNFTEEQLLKHREMVSNIIGTFTKVYPGIKIVAEFIPKGELVETIGKQVERGAGPDLFLTNYGNIPVLSRVGAIQALDDYQIDLSNFRSDALSQVRYQGKLYGLPLLLQTQALCYNKDKVKTLPNTLEDLIKQARQGYSVGFISNFTDTFWGTSLFGGRLFDNRGQIILEQGGGWAQWMEWLQKAQAQPNFILNEDENAMEKAFIEGRLAYLVCKSSSISYFRQFLGRDKLGATLLPQEGNRQAAPALSTTVLLFNRVSSPAQTQIALRFAQFLTNKEQQKNLIAGPLADIPVNKNITVDRRLYPIEGTFLEQSWTAQIYPLDKFPQEKVENINAVINYGNLLYQKVLAGEIPAQKAARQFSQKANTELGLNYRSSETHEVH